MKLVSLLSVLAIIASCQTQDHTIKLINSSGVTLDSVILSTGSANLIKILKVNVKNTDTVLLNVKSSEFKSNGHHYYINCVAYIKNETPIFIEDYNDLSGSLVNDYIYVFTNEKKIKHLIDGKLY